MHTQSVFHTPKGRQAVLAYYDGLLDRMTIPYERLTVDTRYGPTFVLAAGDSAAPPLVLLHGSSMNAAMWIRDMEQFSARFRVYAPDLPGEPGRSAEVQLPFDTPDYADWLADTLDALGVEAAVLMGISLGAWLCIRFAVRYPARAQKLILLCPAGVGPQNHAFKDVAMALLAQGEAGVDALFTQINGGAPIPAVMLAYQKLIAVSYKTRQEPVPLFTDAELRGLTMPSAMFFGEKDIMLDGPAAVTRYQRLVPAGKAMLLPGKGHSLTGLAEQVMEML